MEMQEMEIVIDTEGRVAVKVNGVQGPDCLELTRRIENELGTVEERTYTATYYEQPVHEDLSARIRH